jgi:hypothetical protein
MRSLIHTVQWAAFFTYFVIEAPLVDTIRYEFEPVFAKTGSKSRKMTDIEVLGQNFGFKFPWRDNLKRPSVWHPSNYMLVGLVA